MVFSVGQYSRKKEFVDNKQPLEKQLSTIHAYLEFVTNDWKKTMAKNDADRKVREEEERVILEAMKKEQLESDKFRKLLRDANRWHQAKILRDFINAVDLKTKQENIVSNEILTWIEWAKTKVYGYDPTNLTDRDL